MTSVDIGLAPDSPAGDEDLVVDFAAADMDRADELRERIDRINDQIGALHREKLDLTRALAAVWTDG